MRLIIAGGRDFTDLVFLRQSMSFFTDVYHDDPITEVVCGMARGADLAGRRWAGEQGIAVKEFPADWDRHGRRAGPIRNGVMGDYADQAVVFWDGKSRGTKHMIDYMGAVDKPVFIFNYGGDS